MTDNRWNEVSEELREDVLSFLSEYHEETVRRYNELTDRGSWFKDTVFWEMCSDLGERGDIEKTICDFLEAINLPVTFDFTGFFKNGYIANAPRQEDFIDEWCKIANDRRNNDC